MSQNNVTLKCSVCEHSMTLPRSEVGPKAFCPNCHMTFHTGVKVQLDTLASQPAGKHTQSEAKHTAKKRDWTYSVYLAVSNTMAVVIGLVFLVMGLTGGTRIVSELYPTYSNTLVLYHEPSSAAECTTTAFCCFIFILLNNWKDLPK